MRFQISTYAGTPKDPRSGIEYKAATVGYKYGADAAAARVAFDGEDVLHSGPLQVTFAYGFHHDVTMEDDDANEDFDESDLAQPDDPEESDDMDLDDFDDF